MINGTGTGLAEKREPVHPAVFRDCGVSTRA
jgi:hypothetical protein